MKVLVAIITYNEQNNISHVITDLRTNAPDYDFVVIDNGSSDNTVSICRSLGVPCIAHRVNTGSPYGTVMGYMLYAHDKQYDIVCQFDGDGQHMAVRLPDIIKPILDDSADYVIGSRFIEKTGYQSNMVRRIGIKYLSYLVSFSVTHGVFDVTSGFKAYNRSVIDYFARRYRKEIYDGIQMILLSNNQGFRVVEVPTEMRPRLRGESEFVSLYRSLTFPIKATLSVLAYLMRVERLAPRRKHQAC